MGGQACPSRLHPVGCATCRFDSKSRLSQRRRATHRTPDLFRQLRRMPWIPQSSEQFRPLLLSAGETICRNATRASRLAELLDHDSRDPADGDGGLGKRALGREAVAGGDVCERAGSLAAGGGQCVAAGGRRLKTDNWYLKIEN